MKAKKHYDLCMLWQYEGANIEDVLKQAFIHYNKKIGHKPTKVYVNSNVKIKEYDGAILVPDRSMYSIGLICMVI